jgi:hypothetical protein
MELPQFYGRTFQQLAQQGFTPLPTDFARHLALTVAAEETAATSIGIILSAIFHGGLDFVAGEPPEPYIEGKAVVRAPGYDEKKDKPVTPSIKGKSILSDQARVALQAEYMEAAQEVVRSFLTVGYALVKKRWSRRDGSYYVPWIVPLTRYALFRRFNAETGYEYTAVWEGLTGSDNTEVTNGVLLIPYDPADIDGHPTSPLVSASIAVDLLTKLKLDYAVGVHGIVRPAWPITLDPGARTGSSVGQPPVLALNELVTASSTLLDERQISHSQSVATRTREDAIAHFHRQKAQSLSAGARRGSAPNRSGLAKRNMTAQEIGAMLEEEAPYNRIIPLLSGEKVSTTPTPSIPADIQLHMLNYKKEIATAIGVSPTYMQLQPNQFAANSEISMNFQNAKNKYYSEKFQPYLAAMFEFVNADFLSIAVMAPETDYGGDYLGDDSDDEFFYITGHSASSKRKQLVRYPTAQRIPVSCVLQCASVTSIEDINKVFMSGFIEHEDAARHAVAALGLPSDMAINDGRYTVEDFHPMGNQEESSSPSSSKGTAKRKNNGKAKKPDKK